MAELAFDMVGKVIEKLGSLAYQVFGLARNVESDLRELERTMSTIRAVLLDADKKQASDSLMSLWLGQLNDVLHDVEDVLDEIEYQALREQVVATYASTSTKVLHFFSSSMTRAFPFELAHKIKAIRERLDEIAIEKDRYSLTKIREDGQIMHRLRVMNHSFVHPSTVIGRDNDKENIIKLLLHPDASRKLDVIPIVGLGGLGKTTLAKLVYNDQRVVKHFQLKMWVCVSEDFSLTRLIKEILKSACNTIGKGLNADTLKTVLGGVLKDKGLDVDRFIAGLRELLKDERSNVDTLKTGLREPLKYVDALDVDALQSTLRELLQDQKFLLVLDDVWNEDRNKWIELCDLLIGGSVGSKILVTTRKNRVALIMRTVPQYWQYTLEGLSQEDCLSLFVKFAFEEGEDRQHQNLLEIGKEIVRKCKGVPLAVKTLGSLLYSKIDEQEWEFVRDSKIWELEQKEGDILPALRLSYNQLPLYLKRCFAFCSLFPKDYEFNSYHLVQMWMAHGLILETSLNKKQELENVGELYINELLSISFFQDVKKEIPCLPFYTFKMHDLIHDLAISVAQGECSAVDFKAKDIAGTSSRHFSFLEMGQEVPKCLYKLTKVRTVMFTTEPPMSLVEACISRFKYLRLLDLSDSSFEVLPSSIGTMKHLRYLDLSFNEKIKQLPNSICKLHNLQTLLLEGCWGLERLPKDLGNMINLRCLAVTTKYTCLLENGSFNSLRFLVAYYCPRLEVLFQGMDRCLTNLQKLVIYECPSLTSLSLNIKHLTALENLVIFGCPELSLMVGENNKDLKLSLRSLLIIGLPKLKVLPHWIQGSANTLQCLGIEDCMNFKALPEWLPTLKSLHTLELINCPKLSSFPEGTHHLTALKKLKIASCVQLSWNCLRKDKPKIAHVPEVQLFDCQREKMMSFYNLSTEEDDDEVLLCVPCTSPRKSWLAPTFGLILLVGFLLALGDFSNTCCIGSWTAPT